VTEADLLLHVVDASSPGLDEREASVEAVLREIGAADRPRLLVLNKADRTPAERLAALAENRAGCAVVSATSEEGLDRLLAAVASRLDLEPRRVRLSFAETDRRGVSGVYGAGRVFGHEVHDGHVVLDAELSGRAIERYREHLH
jgi:GTP-binding protein HflX